MGLTKRSRLRHAISSTIHASVLKRIVSQVEHSLSQEINTTISKAIRDTVNESKTDSNTVNDVGVSCQDDSEPGPKEMKIGREEESRTLLTEEELCCEPLNLAENQAHMLYRQIQHQPIESVWDLLDIRDSTYLQLGVNRILIDIVKSRLAKKLDLVQSSNDDGDFETQTCNETISRQRGSSKFQTFLEVISTPFALLLRFCMQFDINLTDPDTDNIVAVLEVIALVDTLILSIAMPFVFDLPDPNHELLDPNSAASNFTNEYFLAINEENIGLKHLTEDYLYNGSKSVATKAYWNSMNAIANVIVLSIFGLCVAILAYISIHLIPRDDEARLRLWYQWYFPAIFVTECSVVTNIVLLGSAFRTLVLFKTGVQYFVISRTKFVHLTTIMLYVVPGAIFFTYMICSDWVMKSKDQNSKLLTEVLGSTKVTPTVHKQGSTILLSKFIPRVRMALVNRRTVIPVIIYLFTLSTFKIGIDLVQNGFPN